MGTIKDIPVWEKYLLTVEEASAYFGIGTTKLRRLLSEDPGAGYVLMNGTKVLVKRAKLEKVIDGLSSI